MADESDDKTPPPTSAYLLQPLRTLQQAQQDSQSAQRLADSGQVDTQEPQSSPSEDLAQPQGRRQEPRESKG